MATESKLKERLGQGIAALVITIIGGIAVHHYQKNDSLKQENDKLQQEVQKSKERDSSNIVKLRQYLETLITSCNRKIADKNYYDAKIVAEEVKWTYTENAELRIEYEKKRTDLLFRIKSEQQKNNIESDTNSNFIPFKANFDNSIEFKLTEKAGEQIEPTTRLSFFCTYASDYLQAANKTIQFPSNQDDLKLRFTGQGSTTEFDFNNVKYRITLLRVEDGGNIDVPFFKIKSLL